MVKKNNILRAVAVMLSMVLATIPALQPLTVRAEEAAPEGVETVEDTGYVETHTLEEYVHLKDSEIEKTCLIIGSYVINLKGLTDEAYEQAQETVSKFNQTNRYYKSELAGGKWFDVTTATSIDEITSEGTPVDSSVIENLKLTHRVDASGAITDLRTGFSLSPFDIVAPYNLQVLEELEPIKNQFDILKKKENKTPSDKAVIYFLEQFYETNVRNEKTDKYDNIITGLEKYKSTLGERDKPETWTEEVNKVLKHTDALRRVEAFNLLNDALDDLLNKVGGQEKVKYVAGYYSISFLWYGEYEYVLSADGRWEKKPVKYPWWATVDEYYVNSELTEAIGQAKKKIEESITKNSSIILTEGSTASSFARYQYSNDLMNSVKITTTITQTQKKKFRIPWNTCWCQTWQWERQLYWVNQGNQYAAQWAERYAEVLTETQTFTSIDYDLNGCDTATQKLVDLANITSGSIVDVNSELVTAEEVSGKAYLDYKGKLAEGINEDYKKAVIENAEMTVKQKLLSDQKTSTTSSRLEYQNLLTAYFDRMSSKSKLQTIEKLLNGIPDLQALVPNDDVKNYQLETVADHEEWLRQEFAKALAESGDSTDMDKLSSELSDLEKKRQDALDNNDLAGEKKIAADMEAKQKDIDDLTKKYVDILGSDNSSPSDKARALAELGEGNTASMINSLASDITSGIRNGGSGGNGTGGNGTGGSGAGGSGTGGSGSGTGGSGNSDLLNKMAALDALGQLDPNAASQALSDIENALDNASSLDDSLRKSMESSLGDMKRQFESDLATNASNLSTSALLDMLEGILGHSLDNASSLELASAVLALSRFGYDYNNKNARSLAISYAGDMYNNRDKYIYLKLKDDNREFVSTKALGDVLNYRYVFDDIHYCVTLSKGRTYYTFTKGSIEYSYTGEKSSTLKNPSAFQKTIYIFTDDARKLFNTTAGYIHGCDYAIVVTPQVEKTTTEIYNQMVAQLK